MPVMMRKRNRDGVILDLAEVEVNDQYAVGREGPGESIVSMDDEAWDSFSHKPHANGRWRLTGDERIVEYIGPGRKEPSNAEGQGVSEGEEETGAGDSQDEEATK